MHPSSYVKVISEKIYPIDVCNPMWRISLLWCDSPIATALGHTDLEARRNFMRLIEDTVYEGVSFLDEVKESAEFHRAHMESDTELDSELDTEAGNNAAEVG
jgi:hypothetical protein